MGQGGAVRRDQAGVAAVMTARRLFVLGLFGLLLAGGDAVRAADPYPMRPLRWVVGFVPGGATDIVARIMGQWLSERLGQPVVIENKAGAGSNIAAQAVINSPPDGYTLLLVSTASAINATLYQQLPFNFLRDVAPVASLVRIPNVIVVNPAVPARNVAEFIAYAKANPKDQRRLGRRRHRQPYGRRIVQGDDRPHARARAVSGRGG